MRLNLTPNIQDPDSFYQSLMTAQRDLDDEGARKMNSRLILILANHIGDNEVLAEAIAAASTDQTTTEETL